MIRPEKVPFVRRVVEVFEDDIDGGEAHVTIPFSLEGKAYEIDLSDENAGRLRGALQPYIDKARPSAPARGRTRAASRGPATDPADVRAWAKANGYTVQERGRIPAAVMEAYTAATTGS